MKKSLSFKEKVYQVVAKIPRGQVLSYGEVAKRAGSPRAARAVGNIMHNNPDPKQVPCHRVIATNNKIGGYAWGIKAKMKKLRTEGVVIKNGQIYPPKFRHAKSRRMDLINKRNLL